jgi:hypothetical protein
MVRPGQVEGVIAMGRVGEISLDAWVEVEDFCSLSFSEKEPWFLKSNKWPCSILMLCLAQLWGWRNCGAGAIVGLAQLWIVDLY